MSNFSRKLKKFIKNPSLIVVDLNSWGFHWLFSSKFFLKSKFKSATGKRLNLKNPETFNEKLQWLKLYNHKDIYTTMVDKYNAKKFIEDRVGPGYTIPTLGVYDKFDDIDFEKLPNQFVIKCTHDSGGLILCKDKNKLDIISAKKKINKILRKNYFWKGREWPYKNVERKIIIEQFMNEIDEFGENCLTDYKFFCFNGEPKLFYIGRDKAKNPSTDFFDMNFNHLELTTKDPNASTPPQKPVCFEQMVEFAKILSKDVPFLRVDFYQIDNKLYCGEMTFFHNGGMSNFNPPEWDKKLGDYIDLSLVKKFNK